ncbi:DUF58 domain-containing protein [Paenibacillus tepidiphilus]|uniref:DUF58 domain-containing protein n=1 Tax=Paenibacillus tepidiphilus TaxID=2608683 RepID=UPI001239A072|nr:DUF58 domain-containing protein [Paenibacillus tepidiphilus]
MGAVSALFGSLYMWRGGMALLFLLTASCMLMLGGAMLQLLGPRRVNITRRIYPIHPVAGDTLTIELQLAFTSRIPLPWMLIADNWDGGCHRELLFPGFRRSFTYSYTLEGVPRGIHRLQNCTVTWGDLPGLFTGELRPESREGFRVLPRALPVHGTLPGSGMAAGGIAVLHQGKAQGSEAADIRDYAPGDPLSRIHWKNSARKGTLQSRVPEREQGRMTCIVLANDPASYAIPHALLPPRIRRNASPPAFERAVSAAMGLLLAAERSEAYVQLFSGGWPEGMARYEGLGRMPARVRELLTEIVPDGNRSLARLLEDASRHWIPGMKVTVITGLLDTESARALAGCLTQGIQVELYYMWDRQAEPAGRAVATDAKPRQAGTVTASLQRLGARLYCLDDSGLMSGHGEAAIHGHTGQKI